LAEIGPGEVGIGEITPLEVHPCKVAPPALAGASGQKILAPVALPEHAREHQGDGKTGGEQREDRMHVHGAVLAVYSTIPCCASAAASSRVMNTAPASASSCNSRSNASMR